MPIYCDVCECVIDRDEEHSRIDGTDMCLNCFPKVGYDLTGVPALVDAIEVVLSMDEEPTIQAWLNVHEALDRVKGMGGDA